VSARDPLIDGRRPTSTVRRSGPRSTPNQDEQAPNRLTITLPEQLLADVIQQAAERAAAIVLAQQSNGASRWLNTEQVAERLACSKDRVHDLCQLGKLRPRRDGRRLLFDRAEVDAYVEGGA
jgi:excisionase family DNA binding protein